MARGNVNEAIEQANLNWASGNKIGKRLMVEADEVTKFLPLTCRSNVTMTLKEDLSNTISDRRI